MSNVFIIAEAGVNHNGNLELAYELVDAAIAAEADAVKFQTFKAENLVSKTARKCEYQLRTTSHDDQSQFAMLKELELDFRDFANLKDYCTESGIQFLTTAFDESSADLIHDLVRIYKIPSGEVTNLPFLRHVARKGKPVVLSTGMSTLGEVEAAVSAIIKEQREIVSEQAPLSLLHCTTNYPCRYEEVNLRAMSTMHEAFKLPVGYSDHTMGAEVAIAAVAMGATIIEKHFTIDRSLPGPDQQASLEPQELKRMVTEIRNIEQALGDGIKKPNASELEIMPAVRKSLIATRDLAANAILAAEMVACKRPGHGVSPAELPKVLGMRLRRDKKADEVITWDDLKHEE